MNRNHPRLPIWTVPGQREENSREAVHANVVSFRSSWSRVFLVVVFWEEEKGNQEWKVLQMANAALVSKNAPYKHGHNLDDSSNIHDIRDFLK